MLIKRIFDITLGIVLVGFFVLPMLCIAVLILLTSPGPVLYWSDRIGIQNKIFKMPKFRTMRIDTPALATHLLQNPKQYVTPIGSFLRRSSLDELPQLFTVLRGDMSFVGPRPALYNQDDLITLRTAKGIHLLIPGLTGWAQINGRDDLPIPVKVDYDLYYMHHQSFWFDLLILGRTFWKAINGEGVRH